MLGLVCLDIRIYKRLLSCHEWLQPSLEIAKEASGVEDQQTRKRHMAQRT